MAGTSPSFDGPTFRSAIRFVFDMAAPPVEDDQVSFFFASSLVYNTPVDGDNVPFDPSATVTTEVPDPVKVPCAVEYFDTNGQEVVFGTLTASKIAITLLDSDYDAVRGFSYVVLGGQKYDYKRTEPPSGLFDVGLFTVHCTAEDQV